MSPEKFSEKQFKVAVSGVRMKKHRNRKARHGILTFEWMLLMALLVIGIVGAYTMLRDAAVAESTEAARAVIKLDQSYNLKDSVTLQSTYGTQTGNKTGARSSANGSTFTAGTFNVELK